MILLSDNGVLVEPCSTAQCKSDQSLTKGAYVRHLARFATLYAAANPVAAATITAFLQTNVQSMLLNDVTANSIQPRPPWHGDFGFDWRGGDTNPSSLVTASSGVDLLTASAITGALPNTSSFIEFGLGNCADASNNSMPNCYIWTVSESDCATAALALEGTIAYDYTWHCDGQLSCRIRSLNASNDACTALSQKVQANWQFVDGSATNITKTTPAISTVCVLKSST
jgi:hypothetical protein